MSIAEKLTTVAANVPQVFDAGKREERNRFWDGYQFSGPRTDYNYAFAGCGWRAETFKPKHKMLPVQADSMFFHNAVPNLKQAFQDCGVTLDLSHATTLTNAFSYAATTELPEINCFSCTDLNGMFAYADKLETIDKLVVFGNATKGWTTFTDTFKGCTSLKNITIEGTILRDIDFSDCPLTAESTKNIIEHLGNLSSNGVSGKYTVKFSQECWDAVNAAYPEPVFGSWQNVLSSLPKWVVA